MRLGLVTGAAMGVLALAVHSAHGAAPAPDDLGAVSTTAATVSTAGQGRALPATGQATATGVRAALEQAARARTPSGIAAGPTPGGDQSEPVDESRPHSHVVDPSTGGLVSVTGAHGVVSHPDELGPVHLDPVPPGTSLTDPTDTATLLERAEVEPSALADAEPITAGATAPVGTPGVSSLSQHVLPSCSGTGTDGNRVQVLYVHEADTASRFSAVLPALRSAVAAVDDVFAVSSQQTGGGRRVRWVHDASCFPMIRSVSVPDGALGSDFWGTVTALKTLGYTDPHRKYLMFADANALCGIGTLYADTSVTGNYNDGYAASYSRVDTNCWSSSHSVAAHELTHNLGGVQAQAPHSTPNGHCYDDADLMCYVDGPGVVMKQVCASAQEQLLDCNHDDYFNTAPAPGSFLAGSWNTARSSFLDVVPVLGSAPSVTVRASTAAAQTGDTVTLTATAPTAVTWTWAGTAGCRLTPSGATASVLCPATTTGPVTVTATATDVATGSTTAGSATVSMTRAAAPTAAVTAPTSAVAGTPFTVGVTAAGKGPLGYSWRAGSCSVAGGTTSPSVSCPAGTTGPDVPVSVVVTQADGQKVTAVRRVALTAPGAAPVATSWTTPRVVSGAITAVLHSAAGSALVDRPVTAQAHWHGTTTWVTLAGLTTDATGTASVPAAYGNAGSFRFTSGADSAYAAAVSPTTYLKVSTRLSAAKPAAHRLVGTLATVAGPKVSGATLVLQRRLPSQTAWTVVGRYRTDGHGVASRLVYPARSTYFRWVFAADTVHVGSTSGRVTVSP